MGTGWWFGTASGPKPYQLGRPCRQIFGWFVVAMKGLTGPGAEDLQYLYNPDWTRLTSGSRVSVVVTDLIWQGLTCVGKLCPGEQRVRVVGCFPPEACGFPTLALLDAVFWTSLALWICPLMSLLVSFAMVRPRSHMSKVTLRFVLVLVFLAWGSSMPVFTQNVLLSCNQNWQSFTAAFTQGSQSSMQTSRMIERQP